MTRLPCPLLVSLLRASAYMANTNFVGALDASWRDHNASNVIVFVEQELATNQTSEVYFARGIVAAYLQEWGVGATNYFRLARDRAETDARYTASYRAKVTNAIAQAGTGIEGVMEVAGQQGGSPYWNTNTHAVIFTEYPEEIPFQDTIKLLALPPD